VKADRKELEDIMTSPDSA